jgi:putative chitinase
MTLQQLIDITGKKAIFLEPFLAPLNECFEKYSITSGLRQSHFLAQVLHESGCFRYLKEIASGEAYEGRKDLGNTQPGDGKRFKGRGLIQITGRANYIAIGYVDKPEQLEKLPDAVLSAGWYWNRRNLNNAADVDSIESVTRKINGGLNGLKDRIAWFEKCKEVLL